MNLVICCYFAASKSQWNIDGATTLVVWHTTTHTYTHTHIHTFLYYAMCLRKLSVIENEHVLFRQKEPCDASHGKILGNCLASVPASSRVCVFSPQHQRTQCWIQFVLDALSETFLTRGQYEANRHASLTSPLWNSMKTNSLTTRS